MITRPERVFGRAREWEGLSRFVAGRGAVTAQNGAALGVVSGRRRQGKSFLLQALTEATGGMYFAATEATEAESLRLFTEALTRHTREVVDIPPRDWNDAVTLLFRAFRDRQVPVVVDEFPFLTRSSPALPSIIQRELGPGGSGRESRARLVLCGSAMSVMGGLLAGQAPLRGRAGLELVIHPFRYREAADFWGITDPRLAVLVHAVLGGTPAYRYEFTQGDVPADLDDFDAWVIRTVLNPQTPLFREARYLLAEESEIRDPALYHSVLAAIASGNSTNGGIANYVGRRSDQITHPLHVLEDCALVAREPDLFRSGRARYRIVEPLITFYEAIMRRRWSELEIHRAKRVWGSVRQSFLAQVVGPHFEMLCRDFAVDADQNLYGDFPAEVGAGTVPDPARRSQIEIDVAVLAAQEPGRPRRVLSLGEAKWGEVMGRAHLARLERARELLEGKGYDTRDTVLACYGGSGFASDLTDAAGTDPKVLLVGLDRLYGHP
ncbi:AAA family ATPase [Nonomuraea roseoviolacea]|uniref:AAA+ ATPase superfamily predicted ATPase n=1 Tax=Nonomuraea roseoviolacea subsp. carminata TaxID=160689 RepID=A0ABT1JVV3_9ACTN|nr:ATP-binding protein [Nonomuraea roseoviolacea]MCP2345887.1 AAA+ ATPase superfamily predicted ATPase [Nonomuraea roseoviolacea subsp. carminata]